MTFIGTAIFKARWRVEGIVITTFFYNKETFVFSKPLTPERLNKDLLKSELRIKFLHFLWYFKWF